MKNIFFFLIAMMAVATSCNKEKCEAGSLSETLIGEWTVSYEGLDLGDVEFEEDGTLIDPTDALVGGENGSGEPLNIKSYVVDGDEAFSTSASDGSNSITVEYEVTDYSCDDVSISILGLDVKMRRK